MKSFFSHLVCILVATALAIFTTWWIIVPPMREIIVVVWIPIWLVGLFITSPGIFIFCLVVNNIYGRKRDFFWTLVASTAIASANGAFYMLISVGEIFPRQRYGETLPFYPFSVFVLSGFFTGLFYYLLLKHALEKDAQAPSRSSNRVKSLSDIGSDTND